MFLYLGIIWALGLGTIWALFGHYLGTRLGLVVEASAGLRREQRRVFLGMVTSPVGELTFRMV